jgi:hypothetical protein
MGPGEPIWSALFGGEAEQHDASHKYWSIHSEIEQKYLLQLYSLQLRPSSPKPVFYKVGMPNSLNATIEFSSKDANYIYADDGKTAIGYQYLLAIIVDFDS